MEETLKREFEYYRANQDEMVKKHNGKFVVIKDQKVLGAYDSAADAVNATTKSYDLGTFLVQKVEPGNQAFTQTFRSRASFKRTA